MASPPRIAQVLLKPQIGGAETLVDSLATQFQARGIENTVVYLDPEGTAQTPLARLRQLARTLREYDATHLLAHSALPNLYTRLVAPRGTSRICVLHSATDDWVDPKLRTAERLLLRRTDAVVAVSQRAAQQYLSRFSSIRTRVHVIDNGVSPAFAPGGELPQEPSRFLSVARVAQQKNPELWAEVVRRDSLEHPDNTYEWWGPPATAEYAGLVAEHSGQGRPGRFRGATEDASEVMRAADVFLHTADAEANSIVLLEAAATGLPIVCSQPVAETLPEGLVAFSFAVGDAGACVETLDVLRRDWDEARSRARSVSSMVRANFGIERTAERYLAVMALS